MAEKESELRSSDIKVYILTIKIIDNNDDDDDNNKNKQNTNNCNSRMPLSNELSIKFSEIITLTFQCGPFRVE